MSIEPTNAFTVFIRAGKRSDEGRTLQDYQDDLRRRFGKLPSLAELARRENIAAKRNFERTTQNQVSIKAEETRERRLSWALRLVDASPVTRQEASGLWDVPAPAADSRLQSLEAGGFAVRVQGVRPIMWQIVVRQEAAE